MYLVSNLPSCLSLSELLAQVGQRKKCQRILVAVAYVSCADELLAFSRQHKLPLSLWCRCDPEDYPSPRIVREVLSSSNQKMFFTRGTLHAKVIWFQGDGVYIGSANLTDNAWNHNCEMGVYIPEKELINLEGATGIEDLFKWVEAVSRPATDQDVVALTEYSTAVANQISTAEDLVRIFDSCITSVPSSPKHHQGSDHLRPGFLSAVRHLGG